MGNLTNAVCFTCGLAIESPPRLSRLTNGQICPACRERVLEDLPPALPSRATRGSIRAEADLPTSEFPESDEDEHEELPDGRDASS
jgi:hypothetical protein